MLEVNNQRAIWETISYRKIIVILKQPAERDDELAILWLVNVKYENIAY